MGKLLDVILFLACAAGCSYLAGYMFMHGAILAFMTR
jgi:hypothetical protein